MAEVVRVLLILLEGRCWNRDGTAAEALNVYKAEPCFIMVNRERFKPTVLRRKEYFAS